MDTNAQAVVRHHSGMAIIALVLAVAAVVTPTPLNTPIALFALLLALRVRSQLRGNPQLRGTVASLGAFIVALGVLVIAFLSFWLPLIIGLTIVWGSPQL